MCLLLCVQEESSLADRQARGQKGGREPDGRQAPLAPAHHAEGSGAQAGPQRRRVCPFCTHCGVLLPQVTDRSRLLGSCRAAQSPAPGLGSLLEPIPAGEAFPVLAEPLPVLHTGFVRGYTLETKGQGTQLPGARAHSLPQLPHQRRGQLGLPVDSSPPHCPAPHSCIYQPGCVLCPSSPSTQQHRRPGLHAVCLPAHALSVPGS